MHVTIVHLTEDKNGTRHSEDEVFEKNEYFFPDGVTEEKEDMAKERLDGFVRWLGDAVTTGADKRDDGTDIPWLEIDATKLEPLFKPYYKDFADEVRALGECSLHDFSTNSSKLRQAMFALQQAYKFDWAYVLTDYGDASPISAWLRALQYEGVPQKHRLYVQAVYDGDQ